MLTGKSIKRHRKLTLNDLVTEVMEGNLPPGTYLSDERVDNEVAPPHEKYTTISSPINVSSTGYVSSTPAANSAVHPVKDWFTITQEEEVTLETVLGKLIVVLKNPDGTHRLSITTNHSVGWVLRQHPANVVKSVTILEDNGELVKVYNTQL